MPFTVENERDAKSRGKHEDLVEGRCPEMDAGEKGHVTNLFRISYQSQLCGGSRKHWDE